MKPFLFALVATLLPSCSPISESERLIEVPHARIERAVLIEDFTGQRCVNCPQAAAEIERLQQDYGQENIVAVAIHSGPLAIFSNSRVTGLRTDWGDAYYDHWGIEAEPSGLIDRRGGVVLVDKWASLVHQALQTEATVKLKADARLSGEGTIAVNIEYLAVNDFRGQLQLWVTEDSIVAPQMQPDGTLKQDYMHHHVFRAAFNGLWGDEVNWPSGSQGTQSFTASADEEWNPRHLSVVAFIYDDSGVHQACQTPVILSSQPSSSGQQQESAGQ